MSIYIYIYKEIKYKRPYWIKFNKIGVNFWYEIINKLIYLKLIKLLFRNYKNFNYIDLNWLTSYN